MCQSQGPAPSPLSVFRAMVFELRRGSSVLLANCAVVTCALVALPVALTLARDSWFDATIEATAGADVSPAVLRATVRQLLRDPTIVQSTIAGARVPINEEDLADRVTVAPSARGALVRVEGRTPGEARQLARVLRSEVSQVATRQTDLRFSLGSEHVSSLGFPDRVVDALPGAFPRRNGPVWVGVAGFVAAAIVCTALALLSTSWGRTAMSGKPSDGLPRLQQGVRS
jgi:hypothetical protein